MPSHDDAHDLARNIPSFDFLSSLRQQSAASGAGVGGTAGALPGMQSMSHWIAPVFDVEEIDRRIHDLRTVHFWLEQNTRALAATIQALELQKMTLLTLKNMNLSMQEVAEAFTVKPAAAEPPAAAARFGDGEPVRADRKQAGAQAQAKETTEAAPAAVDAMQWWAALTEQFQTIANQALRDMAEAKPRASDAPQSEPAKPKKRRPPAPRAARASG